MRPKRVGAAHYEIVAGERRWRAAKLAGLRNHSGARARHQGRPRDRTRAAREPQRTDLNPIEEASGYRQLIAEYDFTQEVLAQRLGKARPTVANALRLLSLPDAVQAMVRDGKLSAGHARALAALPGPKAVKLARQTIEHGWNVRELERAVSPPAIQDRRAAAKLPPELPADFAEVESRLRFALATRVALRRGAHGGSIEIHYADDDELQRIVDRICPEAS